MKYHLIILLIAALLTAQVPGTWTTFGDANFTNCCIAFDDALYVGSRGGIIKYIPGQDTEDWQIMTNIHGLGGLDVIALIEYDGELYYAASNGALGRLEAGKWTIFPDLIIDNVGITGMVEAGGHFYTSTVRGVSKLRPLGGNQAMEVAENFNKIGIWDRNYPVNAITADDSTIWIGSDAGLAFGRIDGSLFVPEAWTNFATSRPVVDVFADSGGVRFILKEEDSASSIFFFDGEVVDTLEDTYMHNRRLDGFFRHNGDLYVHGNAGLFKRNPSGTYSPIRLDAHWAVHGGAALADSLYLALEIGFGVIREDTIRHKSVNSPAGTAFRDIAIAPNGDVLIISSGNGACVYSDGVWENLLGKYMPIISEDSVYTQVRNRMHRTYRSAYDGDNGLWLGMTGEGVFVRSADGEWQIWDKTNSILDGYSASPDAPLCWGLDYDETRDLMWVSNYDNIGGLAVAAFDLAEGLNSPYAEYYTGISALPNNYVMSVTAQGGDVWLVLRDQGVTLIDPGYDISSYGDDYIRNFSGELPSASANKVAVDSEGIAWVGISGGVVSIDPSFGLVMEQVLPENLSTFVSGIAVDENDNVWVSTDQGAGFLRRADSSWVAIRSEFAQGVNNYERTDLATELLYAVEYNPVTGDVWFCGENAISVLHLGKLEEEGDEDLLLYPNPYIWDGYADNKLRIAEISPSAEVHIYSADGSLVRSIPVSERISLADAEWDGRNDAGKPVASGVYVVVASDGESVRRGKVALIRSGR